MRKAAVAVGVTLLVLVGIGVAVVLHRERMGRDVRGSSTVEYNVTQIERPVRHPEKIVWPTYGFDGSRLRVGPVSRLRPPFRVAWLAGGRSLLEFPPSIAYGRLYLTNGAGTVLAFSTKTGARAWDYPTRRCAAASPTVGDYKHGTVYAVFLNRRPCTRRADDGEVVALSVGTGELRWSRRIGASETSPLLVGNRLYVGDWLGKVYCLDARTGKTLWTFTAGGAVKGGVAIEGKHLFVGAYDGHVYALNPATGRLIWRASGDPRLFGHGTFYSTPAVAYDRVYIGSTDGKIYSFGAQTGRRRWSHSTGGYVYGSPAVWDHRVYVGSYDHTFYAFDAATGAPVWRFHANGPISGSATVINGVVYFATLKRRTYALDARSGRLLWSFPDGEYSPVVSDLTHVYLLGYARLYGLVPR